MAAQADNFDTNPITYHTLLVVVISITWLNASIQDHLTPFERTSTNKWTSVHTDEDNFMQRRKP